MKKIHVKFILNYLCKLLVLPIVIPCKLEELRVFGGSEAVFQFCGQLMALVPGLPGSFLRRAFYSFTLRKCSNHCHIGFGSFFSHRDVVVEDYVYIGNYSMIGTAHLGENCLIGSRVSILSGKMLHTVDENGNWTPFNHDRLEVVGLGRNVWVGEGAVIMASIGEGSMVGAGAVLTTAIRSNILVVGNPARFVRNLKQ